KYFSLMIISDFGYNYLKILFFTQPAIAPHEPPKLAAIHADETEPVNPKPIGPATHAPKSIPVPIAITLDNLFVLMACCVCSFVCKTFFVSKTQLSVFSRIFFV